MACWPGSGGSCLSSLATADSLALGRGTSSGSLDGVDAAFEIRSSSRLLWLHARHTVFMFFFVCLIIPWHCTFKKKSLLAQVGYKLVNCMLCWQSRLKKDNKKAGTTSLCWPKLTNKNLLILNDSSRSFLRLADLYKRRTAPLPLIGCFGTRPHNSGCLPSTFLASAWFGSIVWWQWEPAQCRSEVTTLSFQPLSSLSETSQWVPPCWWTSLCVSGCGPASVWLGCQFFFFFPPFSKTL